MLGAGMAVLAGALAIHWGHGLLFGASAFPLRVTGGPAGHNQMRGVHPNKCERRRWASNLGASDHAGERVRTAALGAVGPGRENTWFWEAPTNQTIGSELPSLVVTTGEPAPLDLAAPRLRYGRPVGPPPFRSSSSMSPSRLSRGSCRASAGAAGRTSMWEWPREVLDERRGRVLGAAPFRENARGPDRGCGSPRPNWPRL
jgi:hypothetical protein